MWYLTEQVAQPLNDADWVITAFDVTLDGKTFVIIRTDDRHPPGGWLGVCGDGEIRRERLNDFNLQTKSWRLSKALIVQWQSDGGTIDGMLRASDERQGMGNEAANPTASSLIASVNRLGSRRTKGTGDESVALGMGVPVFLALHGYAV